MLVNILWEISANPVDICNAFVSEGVNCFSRSSINLSRSWKDINGTVVGCENNITKKSGQEHKYNVSSKDKGQGSAEASANVEIFHEIERKELIAQGNFKNPRELLKRSGELLEVFKIVLLTLHSYLLGRIHYSSVLVLHFNLFSGAGNVLTQ